MKRWKLRHSTEAATLELAFLFQSESVKYEIKRILDVLASQSDPRSPDLSSGLLVDEVEFDAPGWFRVKVPRYGIRIVFRLLIVREEQLIEIGAREAIDATVVERYIDIMQAAYRKDAYGAELRNRYRQRRNK